MKTPADILMEARPYIDKGWCQNAAARDAAGQRVKAEATTATAWCAIGALVRSVGGGPVWRGGPGATAWQLFEQAVGVVGAPYGLAEWNDTPGRTKEEVLDAFDRAIALALDEAES